VPLLNGIYVEGNFFIGVGEAECVQHFLNIPPGYFNLKAYLGNRLELAAGIPYERGGLLKRLKISGAGGFECAVPVLADSAPLAVQAWEVLLHGHKVALFFDERNGEKVITRLGQAGG
jgi:hypothetical protein